MNGSGRGMMTKICAVQSRKRLLLVPALLLGLAGGATAQETQKRTSATPDTVTKPPLLQSDLSKDNLDRVAASPAQIKEVLIKDPGLMVELKR